MISLHYLNWMPFSPLRAMDVTGIRVLCFLSPSFPHFLTMLSVLYLILCEINCNDAGGITQLQIKLQYRLLSKLLRSLQKKIKDINLCNLYPVIITSCVMCLLFEWKI